WFGGRATLARYPHSAHGVVWLCRECWNRDAEYRCGGVAPAGRRFVVPRMAAAFELGSAGGDAAGGCAGGRGAPAGQRRAPDPRGGGLLLVPLLHSAATVALLVARTGDRSGCAVDGCRHPCGSGGGGAGGRCVDAGAVVRTRQSLSR